MGRTRSGLLGIFLCCAVCAGAFAEGDVLTKHRTNVRDWTVRINVNMRPDRMRRAAPLGSGGFFIPRTGSIEFKDASFVFPILAESAVHETYLDRTVSRTIIKGRKVTEGEIKEVAALPDERELELTLGPVNIQDVITFKLEYPMTCYETRIDERRAMQIEWLREEWPEEARPYLKPQHFIESNDASIKTLVEAWTKGEPRRAKPYYLAKYLTGKTLEHYLPTEGSYREQAVPFAGRLLDTKDHSGFLLNGASHAAQERRGPIHDLVNLQIAVFRAAGIPARLVIALDPLETDLKQFPVFHSWSEFYLYDEPNDRGEWIPVDIIRQRAYSSKAPPINRAWEFFGKHELTDKLIPIASRWRPLRPGHGPHSGPALFGWLTDPDPQICRQELRIVGFETPMKAGSEELEKRKERSRPPAQRK